MRSFNWKALNIFRKKNKVGCVVTPTPTTVYTTPCNTNDVGVCVVVVVDYIETQHNMTTSYSYDNQQNTNSRIDEIMPILPLSWSTDSVSALANDQDMWEHQILSLGDMKALGLFSFKGLKYRARYMLGKEYDFFGYQLLSNEEF